MWPKFYRKNKTIKGKEFWLDIKVLLNSSRIINLEMQVNNRGNWEQRSLSYTCRLTQLSTKNHKSLHRFSTKFFVKIPQISSSYVVKPCKMRIIEHRYIRANWR
ncbi:MAG: PD-(D/E)XK nuclease family transposase [Lachnospiraceae bacterium]|nr:PD-(D/E)XK nuclease family transposase [Lachnospiraceae bacterium]